MPANAGIAKNMRKGVAFQPRLTLFSKGTPLPEFPIGIAVKVDAFYV